MYFPMTSFFFLMELSFAIKAVMCKPIDYFFLLLLPFNIPADSACWTEMLLLSYIVTPLTLLTVRSSYYRQFCLYNTYKKVPYWDGLISYTVVHSMLQLVIHHGINNICHCTSHGASHKHWQLTILWQLSIFCSGSYNIDQCINETQWFTTCIVKNGTWCVCLSSCCTR